MNIRGGVLEHQPKQAKVSQVHTVGAEVSIFHVWFLDISFKNHLIWQFIFYHELHVIQCVKNVQEVIDCWIFCVEPLNFSCCIVH